MNSKGRQSILFLLFFLNIGSTLLGKESSSLFSGQKLRNFAQKAAGHITRHFPLYALSSWKAYYHLLNQNATYDLYTFQSQDTIKQNAPNLERTFKGLCQKLSIDPKTIDLRVVLETKKWLPPFFPSPGMHVVGCKGIIINRMEQSLAAEKALAHELTHIKNRHVPIVLTGAFFSPLAIDIICNAAVRICKKYQGNNAILKILASGGQKIAESNLARGIASFICALKILHGCEDDADTAYAKKLCRVDDLKNGKCVNDKAIPIVNIAIGHIWHPPRSTYLKKYTGVPIALLAIAAAIFIFWDDQKSSSKLESQGNN